MSETYSGADNGASVEEFSIVNTNVNNSTVNNSTVNNSTVNISTVNNSTVNISTVNNSTVNNLNNHTKRARPTKYERKIEYEARLRTFLKTLPRIYEYLDLLSSYPGEKIFIQIMRHVQRTITYFDPTICEFPVDEGVLKIIEHIERRIKDAYYSQYLEIAVLDFVARLDMKRLEDMNDSYNPILDIDRHLNMIPNDERMIESLANALETAHAKVLYTQKVKKIRDVINLIYQEFTKVRVDHENIIDYYVTIKDFVCDMDDVKTYNSQLNEVVNNYFRFFDGIIRAHTKNIFYCLIHEPNIHKWEFPMLCMFELLETIGYEIADNRDDMIFYLDYYKKKEYQIIDPDFKSIQRKLGTKLSKRIKRIIQNIYIEICNNDDIQIFKLAKPDTDEIIEEMEDVVANNIIVKRHGVNRVRKRGHSVINVDDIIDRIREYATTQNFQIYSDMFLVLSLLANKIKECLIDLDTLDDVDSLDDLVINVGFGRLMYEETPTDSRLMYEETPTDSRLISEQNLAEIQ